MARKTINVAVVVETANRYLSQPDVSAEFKKGVAMLVSKILNETDQYAGFGYNDTTIHPVDNRDQWTQEMEFNRYYCFKNR